MKVVLIDFDGTITQENLFPEIGKVRNHAFEAIKTLQKRGWTCCLWTCRTGKTLEKAKRFLETNGVFMDYYNESPYDDRNFAGRKPIADVYIDDGYSGLYFANRPDFQRMMEDIYNGNDYVLILSSYSAMNGLTTLW